MQDCPIRRSRIANPCQHSDEHHNLDAISLQEEWNQKDAERLGHLRDGYQERSIVSCKGIKHRWIALETGNERSGIAIGYLQTHTEHAREDEEHRHLAALEEFEGIETPCLYPAFVSFFTIGQAGNEKQ